MTTAHSTTINPAEIESIDEASEQELDLTQTADLATFLEHIHVVYEEALEVAVRTGDETAAAHLERVFRDLEGSAERCQAAGSDAVVTDAGLEAIQVKYNKLIDVCDALQQRDPPGPAAQTTGGDKKDTSSRQQDGSSGSDARDTSLLPEQTAQLLARIEASPHRAAASILPTAREKAARVLALYDDPVVESATVEQAYRKFEQYVLAHQLQWLTVCGLPLPEPGPGGMRSVQAFREGLIKNRDRHPVLQQHPKKQLLVDKLIRKLVTIPRDGLIESSELREVIELAWLIDVPQAYVVAPLDTVGEVRSDMAVTAAALETQDVAPMTTPRRKDMTLSVEDNEGHIAIHFNSDLTSSAPFVSDKADMQNTTSRAGSPADTPQNASVIGRTVVQSRAPKTKRQLTDALLAHEYYGDFIQERYGSARDFERSIDAIIADIERENADLFERWLGEETYSPFAFIEDKTVDEVAELTRRSDIREELAAANVKYETFVVWADMLDEMRAQVPYEETVTFGELFGRWFIEHLLEHEATNEFDDR